MLISLSITCWLIYCVHPPTVYRINLFWLQYLTRFFYRVEWALSCWAVYVWMTIDSHSVCMSMVSRSPIYGKWKNDAGFFAHRVESGEVAHVSIFYGCYLTYFSINFRCQSAVQLLCKKSESAPTLSSSHRSTVNYRNHLERCILSQGSTNAQQAQKHSERNSSKMTDKSITRTPPSSRPVSGSSRSSGIRSSLDAVQDREMYLKPSNCQKLSTSVGVLIDHTSKSQPPTSPRPDERGENIVILRHQKKSIHRSHSDLSYRPCRNSSDFSDLSSRLSRTSAELERFFNEMGLDKSVLNPLYGKHRSGIYSDFDLFESLSSLDSPDTRSVCSGVSKSEKGHVDPADMAERSTATSIVEKNARIIRWLCSVKKAKAKPTWYTQSSGIWN